jgi:exonuclease SbcC
MLLKSLRLKNIRSYCNEEITFPEGIVLLAGDIGAGKSTILLAIEFALFGLLRGELSGTALLRNGANQGSVELTFELNGKDYTIGRTLQRTKTSVEQDAGYLIENGLRREATAVELKATVLGILGYPAELLTKSKSLMYRYTVYTPQEEMKRIVLEDTESRLMILRKVFDIDKYKRISDNAIVYARHLREQKNTYEAQLLDEPLKKRQLQEKHDQARLIQKALLELAPQLSSAKQAVQQQKLALESLENERATLAQHRATLEAAEAELNTLAQHNDQASAELAQVAAVLQHQTPEAPRVEEIAQQLRDKQQELLHHDAALRTHLAVHAELNAKKQFSEATAQRIQDLDECPTCLQKVDAEHKHRSTAIQQQHAAEYTTQLATCEATVRDRENAKTRTHEELLALQNNYTLAQTLALQLQQHKLHQQRKATLELFIAQLATSRTAAEQRRKEASEALKQRADIEQRFLAERQKLDTLAQKEQHAVVEHARMLEQAAHFRETIALLEKELAAKEEARKQAQKLATFHHWMSDFFNGLMQVMEQHVLTKVYHDFNALFQQWFSILIENDVLVARLDENFSPVVQQDGYDTDVDHLSGGEKTACALAYRLALNKVINELHATIMTKNLLILDEPTDGFSAEQLQRMRDVLEQVRARQVVIVSHEAMIESMVDHVLRVTKEGNTSTILV